MTARIVALFPSLADVNGDAQNALVLARRAQWAGEQAEVVAIEDGDDLGAADAVVLGSSTDSTLGRVRALLEPLRDRLLGLVDDGVPVLAVGTGFELLGARVRLASGAIEGLGLLPGESAPLEARVAGDLVVKAHEGLLVGYENHSRGFRLDPGVTPLGQVVRGVGDGRGVDGIRHGSVLATRMHGPVLAKNPALADAILGAVFGRAVVPDAEEARAADAAAARIRAALTT